MPISSINKKASAGAHTQGHYVERLIGTIRREYLNHTFFWNSIDLQRKLEQFGAYYNSWGAFTAPSTVPRPQFVLDNPHH